MPVIAMNKPAGVISSAAGQHGAGTVFDWLLPQLTAAERARRWHCVGRLDKQTTGLLLFTDEPAFVAHATLPATHLAKTYVADVGAEVTEAKLAPLRAGIVLHDGACRPAVVERLGPRRVRLTISEGRNHQIKHMLAAVKLPVLTLHREAIGALVLAPHLPPGAVVRLAAVDVAQRLHWPPAHGPR